MPDYSNSCIYKLCCKDPSVKECYVGSTINFTRRKCRHKFNSFNSNLYVYEFIRDHGGWDNWDMVLIEKVSVNDRRELLSKEREWFEKLRASLNMLVPNRNMKEWGKDHPGYYKKYYLENREKRLQYSKKYHLENRANCIEQNRQYKLENKEQIAEQKRQYSSKKITCECGSILKRNGLTRHLKTDKHAKLIAELNAE